MNWKDNYSILANDQFWVIDHTGEKRTTQEASNLFYWLKSENPDLLDKWVFIARHMKDMGEEARKIVVNKVSSPFCDMKIISWSLGVSEPKLSQALRMIKIGVYPFPWDESIKDAKDLK